MVLPVVWVMVGASALSAALVGAVAATEESCAPARKSYIGCSRSVLKARMIRANSANDETALASARSVLSDIHLLERNIEHGWSTKEEGAALARVTAYTSVGLVDTAGSGIVEVLSDFVRDARTELGKTFGWIVTPPNTPHAPA